MKRVLFLSNGAGEDAIAARILGHLEGFEVGVFPLVGEGRSYPAGLTRWGPGQSVPSQGLARESLRRVGRDLAAGLVGQVLKQWRSLRALRGRFDLVVAVGDLFPVVLAGCAGLGPMVFIGTAKSVYHHQYSWLERWALGRWVRLILARDEPTAESLRRAGLPARWVGNAMMDELTVQGLPLDLEPELPSLALLPGSRQDVVVALPLLLDSLQQVYRELPCQGLVALAPSVELEALAAACRGWSLQACAHERGRVAELVGPHGERVGLVRGALGDVLAASQVALGQAGTANEQAAGAGLPVVAGGGRRLGWYRGRQKGLLGDALEVVPPTPQALSQAVLRLLQQPQEAARRGAVGRERMGPPGGARAMAELLTELLV